MARECQSYLQNISFKPKSKPEDIFSEFVILFLYMKKGEKITVNNYSVEKLDDNVFWIESLLTELDLINAFEAKKVI